MVHLLEQMKNLEQSTNAREIAKRRKCAVIAISQASADAHNHNSIWILI